MTAARNLVRQQREMRERLEDAEKLRLFSRVASEKQKALESSLEPKAKGVWRLHWKRPSMRRNGGRGWPGERPNERQERKVKEMSLVVRPRHLVWRLRRLAMPKPE